MAASSRHRGWFFDTSDSNQLKAMYNGIEIFAVDVSSTTPRIGFLGAAPSDQAAAYTQTYSTAARTVPDVLSALTGGESPTETEHNLVITDLTAIKGVLNALIDDLQEKGLVG